MGQENECRENSILVRISNSGCSVNPRYQSQRDHRLPETRGRPGPTPLGFTKTNGTLVEDENHQRVCEVLDQVIHGEISKRRATNELDTTRRTINCTIEKRGDLYGL